MVVQVAAAFLAILMFAIVMDVPKRYIFYCGAVGAVGWFVYLLSREIWGVMIANFMSTVSIAFLSHIFARILKAPVTVFLIPGFLTLVPGSGLYHTVYYFCVGNRTMGSWYLAWTIQIAGIIALGIFVVDSIFDIAQKQSRKRKAGEYAKKE